MADETAAPKRRRATFTVSHPVQHGFRVLESLDPVARAAAERAAREALDAAHADRLARTARREAKRG